MREYTMCVCVCVCDTRCPLERGGCQLLPVCLYVCVCRYARQQYSLKISMTSQALALLALFAATQAAGTRYVPAVSSRPIYIPRWLPRREVTPDNHTSVRRHEIHDSD